MEFKLCFIILSLITNIFADKHLLCFIHFIQVQSIYEDGQVIDAAVFDITTDQIASSFYAGLRQVGALCFTLNYPSMVTVPHSLLRAYKETLALGLELNTYSFEGLDTIKTILENPEAFAAAAGGGGGGGGGATGGGAAEPKEPTPEPESSVAPVGVFGNDDSSSEESS